MRDIAVLVLLDSHEGKVHVRREVVIGVLDDDHRFTPGRVVVQKRFDGGLFAQVLPQANIGDKRCPHLEFRTVVRGKDDAPTVHGEHHAFGLLIVAADKQLGVDAGLHVQLVLQVGELAIDGRNAVVALLDRGGREYDGARGHEHDGGNEHEKAAEHREQSAARTAFA